MARTKKRKNNTAAHPTPSVATTSRLAGITANLTDPKKTKRYLSIGKIVVPLIAPLAIEGIARARGVLDQRRAAELGVPVERVGAYRGPTGRTLARIDAVSAAVEELRSSRTGDAAVKTFSQTCHDQLHNLAIATHAAAPMPASRRRATLDAIGRELDQLQSQLMHHLVAH
ncbi:hypothetical protein EH165_01425 [Nakamurella antarctica]|uniref:Uncharacterized protein n=1 Tax=Nakamurella antarctica TaxID=1902245 RepID=A0A3G8ZJS1_9ACTN|nr:DUF6474 family protein [Nakamurella antarctica]AZI57027.1 hypothetical protein EH165_01425 [Nakamurella antarctica]